MRYDFRHVLGGAAAGAVLGALAGWLYGRTIARSEDASLLPDKQQELDRGRIFRLGLAVIAIVRQILELG